ncbi:hypothetical protein Ahy_A02g010007 isoform B [Arachis hypogaea]|uniref:Uncharacterized protein n=1 Tax=Arachis hypogaea TaxID=3818 RepID=A0A445EJ24_ARAHY|nr:hypothetical protein Ahy_A02g010007 isoform B [Arachis hypogaea]
MKLRNNQNGGRRRESGNKSKPQTPLIDSFGRPARRRWCTAEENAGLNSAEAQIEIWLSRGSQ